MPEWIVKVVLVAIAIVCAGDAQAERTPLRAGADWAVFGGPNGDFSSPEKGVRTDWADGKLPLVWDIEMGEGYVPPAVAKGRCYLLDRPRGSDRIRLRCVDATTGKVVWTSEHDCEYEDMYGYDGGPRAAPVVDDDRVYTFGPAGTLRCVDAATGKQRWRVDTAKRFGVVQNFFGCGSTPLVVGDKLIVQVGGSPPDAPPVRSGRTKPAGSCVVAFDKKTGDVVYKVGDDLASYASPVVTKVGGKQVGVMFARNGVLGFDTDSGKERFHLPWKSRIIESVNAMTPVVRGSQVFIAECYGPGGALLDVAGDEPKILWKDERGLRAKAMAAHWMTPVIDGEYMYGCTGRHEFSAELRCVRWRDGKVMWSEGGYGRSSMTKVDGRILVLAERGEMLLIEAIAKKFEVVTRLKPVDAAGRARLRYPAWAAPVVSRGMMYVRGDDRLLCYELIPAGADEPAGQTE